MERFKEPNIKTPVYIPEWETAIEYINRKYGWKESDYIYKNGKIIKIENLNKSLLEL